MTDLSIGTQIQEQEDVPLAPAYPVERLEGKRPFWSPAEWAVLRRYYPELGAAGLAPYLPARTVPAITETARKAGIHFNAPYSKQKPTTAQLDQAIKRLYKNGVLESGQMARFCRQWDRPRQWVRMRAIQLGVCQPRRRGVGWQAEEDAILEQFEGRGTRYVQVQLMKAGHLGRTEPAIAQRMKYLDLTVRDRTDFYTAQEVSRLLNLEIHVPLNWIKAGKLKAKKRASQSDAATVAWEIRRSDLRAFMIAYPGEWYPGRCDVYWLVDILANRGGG
jgi:hypothetical protein